MNGAAEVRNSMSNDLKVDPSRQSQVLIRTIAAVVTTVLIAMWAVAGISIKQSQDAAVKNLRADAANLAFAFDEDVTHTLDSIAGAMQAVSNRMAAKRSDMDLYTWAHQFPIISSPTVKAALISPSGSLIAGTWARSLPRENLADQDYFSAPQERYANGLLIGRPVRSPGDGQILIPISKRLEASPGNLIGVLVFFVSPAKLTTLQSLNLGHNGTIALAGLDGVILAGFSSSTPDGLSGAGTPLLSGRPHFSPTQNSEGYYVQRSAQDHVTRIYHFRRGWDYPLVAAVGLDYDEGLSSARAYAFVMSVFGASATVLLGGFSLFLIRELRNRAARTVELAAERTKLQVVNAELIVSKQRAEVANQAKSLFLANMSHELRTPLNAILGFSQIIRDEKMGAVGTPVYAEYAGDIFGAGEHLLEIISNVLDISRIELGNSKLNEEVLDPAEIVAASLATVCVRAEIKKIELRSDIPDPCPKILADPLRLRQIVSNLLSNAIKFTEAGSVSVSLAWDHSLSITVVDTGIGMSHDEIAVGLEPFEQVENAIIKKYEGTGLGLPLAKRLIELHGGTIVITSTKGVGTSVCVQFPADRVVGTMAQAA
jgi:two-component system cell cycle sensor histidine kinase PleC